MRFLLVLSDAFDALWAIRGRVALVLAGVALLAVLVAVYLPLVPSSEPPTPPRAARNPSVQGPVERAKVAPQAALPAPAPQATPPATAPQATAPAPAPQGTAAVDPGSASPQAPVTEQAPAPEATPALEPEPAHEAAPKPVAEPQFQVQVGAFREAARAQKLSRRLTRAGFPTTVTRGTTPDGKPIFRVRTRRALSKGEAQQLVARLRHRVPALRPILVRGSEPAA
ncbi:MAG TPA: SPOR domain-containing protein [Burkholderiales bacterium]|nr:SPOR domain-containing protein [Burkholderiales bacterium]